MINNSTIKEILGHRFKDAQIEVSGSESKFEARIISSEFESLKTIDRHILVYHSLDSNIKSGEIQTYNLLKFPQAHQKKNSIWIISSFGHRISQLQCRALWHYF